MGSMIYIDSSSGMEFLRCQEAFRLKYIENVTGKHISIHQEAGIAVHKAVAAFWEGKTFEEALSTALTHMQIIPLDKIDPKEFDKWRDLQNGIPDMVACYYDSLAYGEAELVEHEFQLPNPFGLEDVTLCGRIDRFNTGHDGTLTDVKTATEWGSNWKQDYRQSMLRDLGLMVYDFYLCEIGKTPTMVQLEVLTKPSERYGRKTRLEWMAMPEIIAYRERTKQQLRWLCQNIKQMIDLHRNKYPWPMSTTACTNKFGKCPYLKDPCITGINDKSMGKLGDRVEHLSNIEKRV